MANQISKRMLEICGKEGLSMNQASMEALVQVGACLGGSREQLWDHRMWDHCMASPPLHHTADVIFKRS